MKRISGQGLTDEAAGAGVRRRYALLRGEDGSGSDSDDAREVRVGSWGAGRRLRAG
jgi:hypothetical protein